MPLCWVCSLVDVEMFSAIGRDGVERDVAEVVEVVVSHTVKHGEMISEVTVETDLSESHDGGRYVIPSVYYQLVDDVGVDPESCRIHRFDARDEDD